MSNTKILKEHTESAREPENTHIWVLVEFWQSVQAMYRLKMTVLQPHFLRTGVFFFGLA